jgi:adenylate kinase
VTSSTLPRDPGRRIQNESTAWRLLLVGPPGAGKSTQATPLASRLGVPYISTGELLRDEVRSETNIGVRVAEFMNVGRLVPDWLLAVALERRLGEVVRRGFVLDGYPRTLDQARHFTRSLGDFCLDRVIEIAVPEDLALHRLRSRGRTDDAADVARARLRTYREETGPMLEFFASAKLVTTVDGARTPETIAHELAQLFGLVRGPFMATPLHGTRVTASRSRRSTTFTS